MKRALIRNSGQAEGAVNAPPPTKRVRRRLRRLAARVRQRSGFTIVEMALAMAAVATFIVLITSFVGDGLRMQAEAGKLQAAMVLAQLRMAQLRADPALTDKKEEEEVSTGVYKGMKVRVEVSQDRIDLAQAQQTGDISLPAVDDQLPTSIQNEGSRRESLGTSERSQTGGLIDVLRIKVVVSYPVGAGFRDFTVQTLSPARRTEAQSSP